MRQTVYIFMFVCLLAFSACGSDVPSPQVEESHILHPDFRAEGLLSVQASATGRSALQTENGEVTKVGVCITAENSHDPYLSRGETRYTFTTDGTGYEGTGITTPMSPLHLNNENATLQAFHPSTATPAESDASDYTIPVNISSAQSFNTAADGQKLQTDYLYGSAQNTVGDATPVTANNTHASPTIYMHHALAKVVFTLQCDKNRTPSVTYDCVKSIKLTALGSGTPFLQGEGTMQIRDGAFAGLSPTGELSFTPGGSPVVAGEAGSPSTVACGLVAPLAGKPGNITLAVTLGKEEEETYDRTYTVTSAAFNVQWQKGYCYTYNMVLGSRLTVTQQAAASWTGTPAGDTPAVTPKEKGIGNPDELAAFATAWNANGLTKKKADGTVDYSPYEPYGWYEKDAAGNRVFTIKITNSFTISKDNLDTWVPIGNATHPLTIPFDGQGWQIILDFTHGKQSMAASDGTYAGIIGYTQSTVSNVRILCTFSGATSEYNVLESGAAAYAGILAGRSDGDITNCTVEMEGTTLLSKPSGGSGTSYYVGGLVGYCSQKVSNCAVSQTYTHNTPATLQVTPSATSTIHLGALAGQVVGKVSNCYTYMGTLCKEEPESATGSTVNAGWLTGDGGSFDGCHYYIGTAKGCGAADYSSVAGATSITGLNGLCTALNAGVEAHPLWSRWAEKQNGADVTAVFLFEYRNKQ